MCLSSYLTRRAGSTSYYARVPVPRELSELRKQAGLPASKSDVWKSLRTSDPAEAKRRLPNALQLIRAAFDGEAEALRAGNAPPRPNLRQRDIEAAVRTHLRARLDDHAIRRLVGPPSDFERRTRQAERQAIVGLHRNPDGETPTRLDLYGDLALAVAAEMGRSVTPGSEEHIALANALAGANLQALIAEDLRDVGHTTHPDANPETVPAKPSRAADREPVAPKGQRLADLTESYLGERVKLSTKEKAKTRATVKLFREHVGENRPASSITRHDAIAFKEALRLLPRNSQRLAAFKGKTFPAIVAAVKAMPEAKRPALIDAKTINSHLSRMSAFWRWISNHDADATPRLFADLQIEIDKRERARDSFTADDIAAIFKADRFHAAAKPDTWEYWGAILGHFTGARLGELCQLRSGDIHMKQGRLVLTITDEGDDQRLKTQHSARTVPVHPELARLGFPEFVERQRKAKQVRLFPEQKQDGNGEFKEASKAFSNFVRGVGVEGAGGFHRFRHAAHDYARRAGFTAEQYKPLFGHAKGDTSGNYGNSEQLTVDQRGQMVDAIPRLPGLKPIKRKA